MIRVLIILSLWLFFSHDVTISQTVLNWTFEHQSTGGGTGISCTSDGICVAALSTVGNGDTYLLRSIDLGESWDTAFALKRDFQAGLNAPSPGDVEFLSDSVVLVQIDSAYVLRSTNAGISWQRHSVSTFNSGRPGHLMRISPEKATCVVRYGTFGPYLPDSTFITFDGGITWTPTPTQPKLSSRSQTFSIQGTYRRGASHFGTIVYFSTDTSTTILLTETADDGATWDESLIPTPTSLGAYGVSITYFNEKSGILTANGAVDTALVMKTWDGGLTWTPIFFGEVAHRTGGTFRAGILTSNFLDSIYGIAGTRDGVMETRDGGYTWEMSISPYWIPLALYYIDSGHAVGIEKVGTVFSSSRDRTSVPNSSVAQPKIQTLITRPNEPLSLTGYFASAEVSFVLVDILGRKVTGGSVTASSAVIRAPDQPGLYFISTVDNIAGPRTLRLMVSP